MHTPAFDWRPAFAVAVLVLGLLSLRLPEVLSGVLPGNDDMMRLQQVRDLLAGQAWYDVNQTRLLTPEGGAMHWSRLPDFFLGGLMLALTPLVGPATAETLSVFIWPLTLLCVTIGAVAVIARRMGATPVGVAITVFFFSTSKSLFQFWPGRIDHHGLQILLVMLALAAILARHGGWRAGALAGVCVAAMVGVAMESLPYAGLLAAGAALFWVARGEAEAERLRGFGLAAAGSAIVFYVLDAPGVSPARAACDAFGTFHAAGLVVGGLLLALLSAASRRFGVLGDVRSRLVAAVGAGALTAGLAVLIVPACLGSPYGAVSESVMTDWMQRVGEARSLDILLREQPSMAVGDLGFAVAGLVATLFCIAMAPADRRAEWLLIGALLVAASLVATWQIRAVVFAHILAAIPAGHIAGKAFAAWRQKGGAPLLLGFAATAIVLAPPVWINGARAALPTPAGEDRFMRDGQVPNQYCRELTAYEALAQLPPARIFAPIDLGTSLLVRTPHSVFAGPYHRNIKGIVRHTQIMQGSPENARSALKALGADYVVSCAGMGELNRYAEAAPGSFGALLAKGTPPPWMRPADGLGDEPAGVRLYRIAGSDLARLP